MTKPFFKRGGDATIYYNYSKWPSRSCNFRKSLGKPRPFLQLVEEFGRRGSRYILSEQEGEEKKRDSGKKKTGSDRRKGEGERDRDEEQKVGQDEGRGGGKINAPSGIARKASVWRAWRATTGLARWSNSRGKEKDRDASPAYKKRVTMQKALHPVARRARFRSESLASDRQTAIDNI